MKLFVTGGLGFIGSNYILNKLNDSMIEILNYDKMTYAGNPDNLLSLTRISLPTLRAFSDIGLAGMILSLK